MDKSNIPLYIIRFWAFLSNIAIFYNAIDSNPATQITFEEFWPRLKLINYDALN